MRLILISLAILLLTSPTSGQVIQQRVKYSPSFLDYSYDPGVQIHRPACVVPDHGFLVIGAPVDTANQARLSIGTGEIAAVTGFNRDGSTRFILRGTHNNWNTYRQRNSYSLTDAVWTGSSFWIGGELDSGSIILGSEDTRFTASRRSAILLQFDSAGRTLSFLKSNDEDGVARVRAMTKAPNGEVLAMGEFSETLRIGDRVLPPLGHQNMFFMRVAKDGKIAELKIIGYGDSIGVSDVVGHSNGSFYAVGTSLGHFFTSRDTIVEGFNGFCLKLSQNGELLEQASGTGSVRSIVVRRNSQIAMLTQCESGFWNEKPLPTPQLANTKLYGYLLVMDPELHLLESHHFAYAGFEDSTEFRPYNRDINENRRDELVLAVNAEKGYFDDQRWSYQPYAASSYLTLTECGVRPTLEIKNDCFLRDGDSLFILGDKMIKSFNPANEITVHLTDSVFVCNVNPRLDVPFEITIANIDSVELIGKSLSPYISEEAKDWRILGSARAHEKVFRNVRAEIYGDWLYSVRSKDRRYEVACPKMVKLTSTQIRTESSYHGRCIDSIQLTPVYVAIRPFSVRWSTGDTTESLIARKSGKYTVFLTSDGCSQDSAELSVYLDTIPVAPKPRFVNDTLFADHPIRSATYTWYPEGSSSFTTNKPYLANPAVGIYRVGITDKHLCESPLSDTIHVSHQASVGGDPSDHNIMIAPNPFALSFTVHAIASGELKLLTMVGATVFEAQLARGLNTFTPQISSGTYILSLSEGGVTTRQLIIKR